MGLESEKTEDLKAVLQAWDSTFSEGSVGFTVNGV